MRRRSFLKLTGGLIGAAIAAPVVERVAAAPLFIPSDRLEMGVPRTIVKPEPFSIYFPPEDWPIRAPYDHDRILAQLRGPQDYRQLTPFFAPGDEITADRANEIVDSLRAAGGNVPEHFWRPVLPGDPIDFASLRELEREVAKANTATLNTLLNTTGVAPIPPGVYPIVGGIGCDEKLIAGDNATIDGGQSRA